ncbi:MAG: YbjN domain-containing protein [Gammaproteobacteria bacterium]|nr:YbjN domain-containing protein [Gammaproteobacteria bacterium]
MQSQRVVLISAVLFLSLMSTAVAAPADDMKPLAPRMTQQRLEAVIRGLGAESDGGGGVLRFIYEGVPLVCVSDSENDRMRIVAPIVAVDQLEPEQVLIMLAANYHSALDARYAISEGMAYGVFIHPLSPLTEAEVESAVRQVTNLVKTFGTTYSSGALLFGGPES